MNDLSTNPISQRLKEIRKEDKERELMAYATKNFLPGTPVSMKWDSAYYSGVISQVLEEQHSCIVDFDGEDEYVSPCKKSKKSVLTTRF